MVYLALTVLLASLLATCSSQDLPPAECQDVQCKMDCESGFVRDRTGCEICKCQPAICEGVQCEVGTVCMSFMLPLTNHKVARCIDPTTRKKCQGPMDPGRCEAYSEQYYYNHKEGICKTFIYNGCNGNDNRFSKYEDCDMTCKTEACPDITGCELGCPLGLVVNEQGCEQCKCVPECQDLQETCMMSCPKGFLKDKDGCDKCECVPPPHPCSPFECAMECESGFLKDQYGCEKCGCVDDILNMVDGLRAEDCDGGMCDMYCEHGYIYDRKGCPMCKCRPQFELRDCELLQDCRIRCEFGKKTDEYGCPICECKTNPCDSGNIKCPPNQKCTPHIDPDGNYLPQCQAFSAKQVKWWCGPPSMCKMHCEHGFYSDKVGCDVCECRSESRPECIKPVCERRCEFGCRYDQDGCQTCECLSDPCEKVTCTENEVCEQRKLPLGCRECPAISRCLTKGLVKRIKLILSYNHPPVEQLDINKFEEAVETSISQMMNVDDEYIRGISVRTPVESTTTVEFHVVTYGDMDLIKAFQKLRDYITDENDYASIFYDGLSFKPSEKSVEAMYSSDTEFELDDLGETNPGEEDNATLIIIIACSVAGGVVLIIVIIIAVVCVSKKNAQKEADKKRQSKISYTRAPDKEQTAIYTPPENA